ncbi:ISKra4 family transposase, partial [Nostoc sp. NZL]|nr:ISKra4 family transposase [Nostoc sp. NZL]MBG1242247.1 ISKra4 family transposase [Nostoc sp. NZL]MBG1243102.1 ISKra4 family transposase [Nostoc sp. NZL]MBG1243143.1 ISKra4 family transposase [Nostoc sp. NZL]MBG1244858.1 ISKra4 family transposase [Nostoc sp. NZL]
MNPEDFKRLETCLQEAAEILYRNTPTEELTSFESIEKAVRTKMLE